MSFRAAMIGTEASNIDLTMKVSKNYAGTELSAGKKFTIILEDSAPNAVTVLGHADRSQDVRYRTSGRDVGRSHPIIFGLGSDISKIYSGMHIA